MIQALFLALSLFDGESLAGWANQGEASWRVEDGSIVAGGDGDGFLVSDVEFSDFRLTLEFWVDATTNSGVFIRCTDRTRIHPATCYELNIWDHHPRQEARTGAIVFRAMPPRARVQTVDKWNTLEVHADGDRVSLSINGVITAELEEAGLQSGFIALQHWEQGTVRFRNIQVMPLED